MKIKKNSFIIFLMMFFNNFLALPLILLNIFRKKESVFLIALFLGILGFYFIPSNDEYDIARYYQMFSNEVLRKQIFLYQKDIYAEFLINFLLKYNLPKNFLAFFSAFISYYFLLKSLFIIMKKRNLKNYQYFFSFILFFISIPIIEYTGIRYLPAASLFVYSIILKYEVKNKYFFIFMVISALFHSCTSVLIFLFFINDRFLKKLSLNTFKVIFIVFILSGMFFNIEMFEKIIDSINKIGYIYIPSDYLFGKWGIDYINSFSEAAAFKNLIIINFRRIIIILFFILIKVENENFNKFMFLLGGLCLLFFPFQTIFERYFKIFFYLAILISISNRIFIKKDIKYKLFYLMNYIYSLGILYSTVKYNYLCFVISYKDIEKISILNIFLECLINNIKK